MHNCIVRFFNDIVKARPHYSMRMFRNAVTIYLITIFFLMFIVVQTGIASETSKSQAAYKVYDNKKLTFDLPSKWKVAVDKKAPDGSRYVGIDTTGISVINIEIFNKTKSKDTNKLSDIDLLTRYKDKYNKTANIFTKLETDKSPFVYSQISRKGFTGLKESMNSKSFGNKNSYIKEFYLIESHDKIAYIVFDTIAEEHLNFTSGFEHFLLSLKHSKDSKTD